MSTSLMADLASLATARPERRPETRPDAAPVTLPENYVKGLIDDQDRIPEEHRLGLDGYIHVSALIGLCPRQFVVAGLHATEQQLVKRVTGGHRMIWQMGRGAEQHIRQQFLKARRNGAFGLWVCACGKSRHTGTYPVERGPCGNCKARLDRYQELALFDHEAHVVGNPDLLFFLGNRLIVVEIKSLEAKAWEALAAPLGDHVFQAAMYHHLVSKNKYAAYPEVVVLYANRGFKFGSPYKEFHVDATAPQVRAQVEYALGMARTVRQGVLDRTLPPRTLCRSADCTRAKDCPVASTCFNLPSE